MEITSALAFGGGAYILRIAPRWTLKSATWLRPPGGVDLAKKIYRTCAEPGTWRNVRHGVLLALVDRLLIYHQIGVLANFDVQIEQNSGTEQNPVCHVKAS